VPTAQGGHLAPGAALHLVGPVGHLHDRRYREFGLLVRQTDPRWNCVDDCAPKFVFSYLSSQIEE